MLMTAADRLPSAEEWAEALSLQRRGARAWAGACPLCGGDDRLHVQATSEGAIVGCRGCIDGHPTALRAQRFGELLRAAGLASSRPMRNSKRYTLTAKSKRRPDARASAARKGNARSSAPYAPAPGDIWAATATPASTPAERYLRDRRRVLSPTAAIPAALGWLPSTAAVAKRLRMPATAAGALCFRYANTTGLAAVSCEALTVDGELTPQRWRRTFGKRTGAVCAVGKPDGAPVVVVEGEVSALAAAVLSPGAQVIAAGGTASMLNLPDLLHAHAHGRQVEVWADNDTPGRMAARGLAAGLQRVGIDATVKHDCATDRVGSDAADWLQQVIDTDGYPPSPTCNRGIE